MGIKEVIQDLDHFLDLCASIKQHAAVKPTAPYPRFEVQSKRKGDSELRDVDCLLHYSQGEKSFDMEASKRSPFLRLERPILLTRTKEETEAAMHIESNRGRETDTAGRELIMQTGEKKGRKKLLKILKKKK